MKVVFFGSSKYIIPILDMLRKNFDLSLVITTERSPSDSVRSYCNEHKVCCYVAAYFGTETMMMLQKVPAPLAVLAYFGLILPKDVLELFPKGILNVHPSLLPKYRGPTPAQTAICNGDKVTGVTLIKLDEEVDHGPIIAKKEEPILPTDTSETVYKRLFTIGSQLLEKYRDKYLQGQALLNEQDHEAATYTKQLTRQDGYIDSMHPPSPERLDRMIRAYHPWPGVWTKLKVESGKLKIVKFLPEQKIQVEGGKPMSYKDFLNGYSEAKDVLSRIFSFCIVLLTFALSLSNG